MRRAILTLTTCAARAGITVDGPHYTVGSGQHPLVVHKEGR